MRRLLVLLALPVLFAGCATQESTTVTARTESDVRMAGDVEAPSRERSMASEDDWGGWKHATAEDYRSLE